MARLAGFGSCYAVGCCPGYASPRPPDPPSHVQSKPGGGASLSQLLLIRSDGTFDEFLDGLKSHAEAFWAEMVAEEIEASLDPADEGLVTRAEVRSWLSTAYLIAPIGRPVCDPKADIRGNEHEGPKRVEERNRSRGRGRLRQAGAMN